ncbi:MAG: MarR family transcriptional regulator [Finegoldia sp.]|nr:MarR family transcriptional regulator [Finegoldia sp.]
MNYNLMNTELSQLLREAYRKLDSLLLPISTNHDLTIMKIKTLFELSRHDELTIGEIGELVGMAGGNISNLCKTLEKEGEVSRARSVQDERIVTVKLTDQGRQTVDSILEDIKNTYDKTINLTKEEYEKIVDTLVLLNEKLDKVK